MLVFAVMAVALSLTGSSGLPAVHVDEMPDNFLEIALLDSGGQYRLDVYAGNPDATACEVTTPNGSYACIPEGSAFRSGPEFQEAHSGLSFAEFTQAIGSPWTLVWDSGVTTMTIDFGVIQEGDFPLRPTLLYPEDGVVYVNPDPNPFPITWSYSVDPCEAQQEDPLVILLGPGGIRMTSDDDSEVDCSTTAWTPPERMVQGPWEVTVYNWHDIRDVPEGLSSSGDPWVLENSEWLGVLSLSDVEFAVPAKQCTWGAVKGLFR